MADATPKKTLRVSHLKWVHIKDMKLSTRAQREFRQSHAEKFAADFDLEALGYPVLSYRDSAYYIVDGNHRIRALEMIGYGDQQVQCEVYEGLTEADEAELFLKRDNRKAIIAFDKFRIGVVAGREPECDIERSLRTNGFVITRDPVPNGIQCTGTLKRIYSQAGVGALTKSCRVSRDAYGETGLTSAVLEGLALVCHRYNGDLPDEAEVARRLGSAFGGVNGLLNKAEQLKRSTGNAKAHCVAAAAVEILNRAGGRASKLPDWWKS